MAYSSTNPLALLIDNALGVASSAAALPRVFVYKSTNASSDILGTGFFAACGYGSRSGVDVRVNDIILNLSATNSTGAIAGRVSWHQAIASTANGSTSAASAWSSSFGFDVTVSAAST